MIDRPQVCRRCNFRRLCFPRAGEAPAAGAAPRERRLLRRQEVIDEGSPPSRRAGGASPALPWPASPPSLAGPGPATPTRRSPRHPASSSSKQHPTPVITTRSPGAEGIRYGFEGGRVVKVGDTYHLFTTEMVADPMWVKTRFGHWTSRDRLAWTRVATVRESSGEFEGKDPRAALWSPLPVWDPGERRWNLFYVAYRSMPTDGTRFLLNHAGEIWRAVSKTGGPEGIRGPFEDVGVVMQARSRLAPLGRARRAPTPSSRGAWARRWRALYGSARTETKPIAHWLVGPAVALVARRAVAPGGRGQPGADREPLHREPDRDRGAGRGLLRRLRQRDAGRGRLGLLDGRRPLGPRAGPRPPAEGGRVVQGAADAPRPRARGRGPLHALLHRLRAAARLDTHPRHRLGHGHLRDRHGGAAASRGEGQRRAPRTSAGVKQEAPRGAPGRGTS